MILLRLLCNTVYLFILFLFTPELVFTELILKILYWIYKIAIHSHICIVDLPTNIKL
jgi:hypothetical protein